jgi:hypothetical protein
MRTRFRELLLPQHPAWFGAVFVACSYAILIALTVLGVKAASVRSVASSSTTLPAELVPWQALVLLIAGGIVVFLLIRRMHARMAWELLLGLTLFLGIWFYAWLLFPLEIALPLAAMITILQARIRRVVLHDAFILLGAVGVALHFAFALPQKTLIIIFLGLAVYDIFAVRPQGIIRQFASALVHRGIVPGLIIPRTLKDLTGMIHTVIHQEDSAFLGAGDLILPLACIARVIATGVWWQTFLMFIGLMLAGAWIGSRGSAKPAPALIPLAIGVLFPYALLVLFHFV